MPARRRFIAAALVLLVLLIAFATRAMRDGTGVAALSPTLASYHRAARGELDGERALANVAYVYRGWRTTGGPWFEAVLDWLAAELEDAGFSAESEADSRYWFQADGPDTSPAREIWDPKYASLQIVSPTGDHAGFDFRLDGFDPTSDYYPEWLTHAWLVDNIGADAEYRLNQRTRLAERSGFTDPVGVLPDSARGVTAQLVHVGEVRQDRETGRLVWTENPGVDLGGRIILSGGDRGATYRLAVQEGAVAALSSQVSSYNNPVVDGEELFPDIVKYAGVPNALGAAGPVAFNISPADERYLLSLLRQNTEPVILRAVAIGGFEQFSEERPLRTLVAEIRGGTLPDERIVIAAHVQEPGANDNASGVGLQLELARAWKKLIDEGRLPRPARTITFLWGAEMTMVRLWAAANPEQMLQVRAGLVLDMVGQNPARTGGIMRVEKTPDPSAVYSYGSDVLPGAEVSPAADRFVRGPDQHTLWGKGRLRFEPYPGFFLNDLYFAAGELVTRDSPGFEVGSNPWEGGSDHDPFLWHRHRDEWYPIPAVLTWHFTDFFYHSSHDTMDKVSADEMRNVGLLTLNVGAMVANAGAEEAMELMRLVERSGLQRMEWERRTSVGHLEWAKQAAMDRQAAAGRIGEAVDDALALEREILSAWATWYREAIASAGTLCGTAADRCAEAAARRSEAIDEALEQALQHAERLAERLKALPA